MSDWADQAKSEIENYDNERAPSGVSVPTGVSEDEAIRSVQEQLRQAGFGCPESNGARDCAGTLAWVE